MQTFAQSILFPDRVIFLHGNVFDTIKCDHIKITNGAVIFRRVARCNDQPAFREFLITKSFALEELQHHGGQSFGYAVDLIQEENAFAEAGFFHQLVN